MRITSRTLALVTTAALSATTLFNLASFPATAQSSLSSSGTRPTAPDLNHTEPGTPVVMPGEFIVQIMGDILGPASLTWWDSAPATSASWPR